MSNNTLVDDIFGFDPQNLTVFQEKGPKTDPNIYKTNPKDSKADDGVYRSKIKILLNPFSPKNSIVPQATYWLRSMDGQRMVRSSLSEGNKNCPLFRAWKRLWFSGDETKKNFAKQVYDKSESQWVLVQIIEDENKPELTGQFKVMKLPRAIYDKLNAKMNPSSGKSPYPVMDYVIGLVLDMEVTPGPDDPSAPERKQREIKYSLSEFGDYCTVIKTDGTPLLTDEEVELVDTYVTAINDSQNGKTEKKRKDGLAKIESVKSQIRPIYEKVIMYVKDNLKDATNGEPLDIQKYCGYQEWDDETKEFVNRFTEMTDACVDPSTTSYESFKQGAAITPQAAAVVSAVDELTTTEPESDGLPF